VLLATAKLTGSKPILLNLDADLPLASSSIDVVLCTDVIEHIVEPNRALAEMCRVMRPGGTVIVFTPPYDSMRWNFAGRHFVDCRLGRVNWNLSMYAIARKKVD